MAYDLEGRPLYPLADLFEAADFPLADYLPTATLQQVFAGLYYTEARTAPLSEGYAFDIHLAFEGELALTPPGAESLSLVIGDASGGWTDLELAAVIGPEPSLSIVDVPATLRVPADVLRDVANNGPASITFNATIKISSNGGLTLTTDAALSLAECEVAGTGVTISAAGVTWNFMPGATLPAATAAGISGEFIGVAFEQVTAKLPPDLAGAPTLTLDYCCVGTGGFTGGVTAAFANAQCRVAGFMVELDRVTIRFQQSRLVSGEVAALVRNVDFFDADVAADLQLTAGGLRLVLAASPDRQPHANVAVAGGLVTLRKPNIIEMTLTAAELRIGAGGGALRLSGRIKPLIALPGGGTLPEFTVEALTITSSGEVSVDGGWIALPKTARAALGPFALELSRVGLGTEANGVRWAGFSGGITLAEGIPISAAVDGLKIRWDVNGLVGVELSGIKLSLEIEGALRLSGAVHYEADRFDGAGTLQLIPLNLTVSVRIVIGRRADYTYLYLYLLVAPPVGVPIFNTGLAIYGLEALFAHNMAPDKKAGERWYLDWYRRPEIGPVDTRKWADVRGGRGFGGGVIIGTFPDKGFAVSIKGLLILVLPGPVLMLDSRANLLRDPAALAQPDAQALFTMLFVYDGVAGTIDMAIEPHYVFPAGGELIDIGGVAEAFYSFNDPRGWYLYLGRRERERRIRAHIIKLFEANAYLMLDSGSVELGGFIGYDAQFDAGPARVILQAFIEGAALVSWRPQQLKGSLHMQARLALTVAGFGFNLGAWATLATQAPKPFMIDAAVGIHIGLPWPLPDIDFTVHLHWETPAPPRVTAPLQAVGISHPLTTASWSLLGQEPVIPLDGRIGLAFERAVNDSTRVAENAVPAPDLTVGDYSLRASLTRLDLLVEDNGTWVPYATPGGAPQKLSGMWQVQPGDGGQGNRRLELWSRTPYDWMRASSETVIPQLEEGDHFDPCDPLGEVLLADFGDHPNETIPAQTPHAYRDLVWTPGAIAADILEVATVTAGNGVASAPPRPYYRCLHIADQFFFVPVPGGGGGGAPPGGPLSPPPAPPLRIDLASDVNGVVILALSTGGWSVDAFDATGARVGGGQTEQPMNVPFPQTRYHATQITVRASHIRRVDLQCRYRMAVLAIATRAAGPPTESVARRQAMERIVERYHSHEPVLEPNRRYKLRVETTVVESNGRSLEGADVETRVAPSIAGPTCTFVEELTFRTEGPPGDTALSPLSAAPEAAPPLDTLETYVREILPPRGAPAYYRSYDLRVSFKADYITQMYGSSGRSLVIDLRSDDARTVTVANSLGPGSEIVLRREERQWLTTLERSTCALRTDESLLVRESTLAAQPAAPLLPRRRYDAVLRGEPRGRTENARPLYQWSFVSSAFLNFADHFRLPGRVRSAPLTAAGEQWLAHAVAAVAAGDPWAATGNERLQRRALEVEAFDGLVGQITIDRALPAVVELTAIVDGGDTWAMLLSSPEPFDWDRIAIALTRRSVVFTPPGCLRGLFAWIFPRRPLPALTVPQDVRLIRDADGSRALLLAMSNAQTGAFGDGDYTLTAIFHRDSGGALPVLSQQGRTTDEQGTIIWSLPPA